MSGLTELLDEAVGPVHTAFTTDDVVMRARHRRRAARVRRAVASVVVLGLVVGGGLLVARGDGGPTRVTTPVTGSSSGVFPDRTRTVLALSDGIDGATFIDLDHRVAVRRPIQGERAGDQPYRLTRVGDSLVVGWGDVYAAPLGGGRSHLLGHATYYVPAVEPGAVWLIDYSGGAIGQGTATFREVDASGRVLIEGQGPDASAGFPAIGVPGTVALETDHGVGFWDPQNPRIGGRDGSAQAFISDARGKRIVWCESACSSLIVHDFGATTPPFVVIPHPNTMNGFDARNARLSPDTKLVAATGSGQVAVFETTTGALVALFKTALTDADGAPQLAWSPDGTRLFFTSGSYMKSTTLVGEFVLTTKEFHVATLPFGGALQGVALSRHDARALLRAPSGSATACVPPTVFPSGRKGACGFRF